VDGGDGRRHTRSGRMVEGVGPISVLVWKITFFLEIDLFVLLAYRQEAREAYSPHPVALQAAAPSRPEG